METWNVNLETAKGRKFKSVFTKSSSLQVGSLNGVKSGYLIGQVIPEISSNAAVRIKVNKKVAKAPPIYPSQVFLGERAIKGLLPKKYPNR